METMEARIAADARFADLAKIRQARAMTPEEKFSAGGELFEEACAWSLEGIAARFPHFSPEQRVVELRRLLGSGEPIRR